MKNYTIYTDGAYSSSRNQGGIAFIILNSDNIQVCDYSKAYKNCTINQMEMLACIIALESIKKPSILSIISDSMYVVGTYTLNYKRKKNISLWERFDKAIANHKNVSFIHVNGHSGDYYNDLCDMYARDASTWDVL